MKIPVLSSDEVIQRYFTQREILPYQKNYLSYYSSLLDGIATDPRALLIPLDDHMVHRGDGIFEAFKSKQRKIYLLNEHIDRLFRSADHISIKIPYSKEQVKEIVIETARAAKEDDLMFRLFVSRGSGGFSANPYEPKIAHLFVVALKAIPFDEKKSKEGVKCGWSSIPQKSRGWAVTKSCNYLPNVMIKKESVDRGLDFTITLDENDSVGESASENILIVDKIGRLKIPRLTHVLSGTTMLRLYEIVKERRQECKIIDCSQGIITKADLFGAREVMIASTTCDIVGVTHFEGQTIADGKVGEYVKTFRQYIFEDQKQGPCLTEF